MPLSFDHSTETKKHRRHVLIKRVGTITGFALLVTLAVGNTLLLRHQATIQMENQDLVSHTRHVLLEVERTELLLKDAESGQRGFLYTGDPKYLESYNRSVGQVMPHIDYLMQLTGDDPHRQARIPELRTLAQEKLDELGKTIALYEAGRVEEARALVKSDVGLVTMNRIHGLIDQMVHEEAEVRDTRTAVLQKNMNVSITCIFLAGGLGVLGLAFLAYYVLLEMKLREDHLHEIWRREEWYRVTLTSIGDAVICANSKGEISFLNLVAERMTGWSLQEAHGRAMKEVFQIVDSVTRAPIANPLLMAVEMNRTEQLPANCVLIRRDGQEFFIEDSAAPIHNYLGEITGSVIVFRDVSEARELAKEILHASEHDFLTGLPNRLLLMDRLGQAVASAKRHKRRIALLFIDLDGFKHINDSLGHLIGDKLLQSIAKRLQERMRAPDSVSRQGGDEFVVVMQDVMYSKDAARTARRVLDAVSEVHTIDDHRLYVTASIGISMYPNDGQDVETLMKNADTAMYQAKEGGRQCYRFFRPSMNALAVERQSIEEDLRHALERNELSLHYQPKVDLRTGAITGMEALLRWEHPTRGFVPPAKFIPIAEDSGLILTIGSWVLKEACAQAKTWAQQGLPITTMAINISGIQFRDASFLKGIFAALSEADLDPSAIELELTESVIMQQPALAASIITRLRDKGVLVSVDDFGTGYSSLSYLKKLPLDTLKIDQSFIHRVSEHPDDAAIAIAIIKMGRSLNLRVIAEGVETAEDLAFLRANGCDEAQGYYFSHPVPTEQFAELHNKPWN
jgi:diguanylate cyclase (GGDEF)-like protein/PAS domain S-box-containing protein